MDIPLAAFDDNCSKCNSERNTKVYVAEGTFDMLTMEPLPEHLQRTCQDCTYVWRSETYTPEYK